MNPTLKLYKIIAIMIFAVVYTTTTIAQTTNNIPVNTLILSQKTNVIKFYWQGDSINSRWEAHTAILLPVKLKNCPKQFYMQFDLGSPYSLLYKNKLLSIEAKYPKAVQFNEQTETLNNFNLKIDKANVLAKEITVKQFSNTEVDWASKNNIEIIGTVGVDFIDGKVLAIDYPNKIISISENISEKLKTKISLTNFVYAQKRILLPAKILNADKMLYFDTGSSMFELLTNEKTAKSLAAPDSKFVQSKVVSWGKMLTVNTIATKDSLTIDGKNIAIRNATFIEGVSNVQAEQMMKMGIGGMTGNKLFLEYTLLLDTKNRKFAIFNLK